MEDFLDLRIIKTKQALMKACFELLQKKVHSKINIKVNEICHKAKINLVTFYHHFSNKNELIELLIKEKLINRLPIPKKFKPKTLANLINYFIKVIIDFTYEFFDIFTNSLKLVANKGRKGNVYWCFYKNN